MLTAMLALSATIGHAAAAVSDLTIEVGGDLLEHGGVVVIYSLPTPADEWRGTGDENETAKIRIDDRYAEVQLRYPESGTYELHFRVADGTPYADAQWTEILTVIGTDMEDRGPRMTVGFRDAFSSGGMTIRVKPAMEFSESDATRTSAQWGETVGNDAVPPADARSARALMAVVDHGPAPFPFQCTGTGRVQTCTIVKDIWPVLEARWWRAIAESRLERLRHHALDRCYDSSWLRNGTCEAAPNSDEPEYIYKK